MYEQVVNEEYDAREKLRAMVLNSQNTIAANQVKLCTRRKVLLLDEFDILLSEKLYRELYKPAH